MSAARTVTAAFAHPPPLHCHVPNLVGEKLARAKAALKNANCSLGRVQKEFSSKRKGVVVGQSHRKGTTLTDHARVAVTVSKGKRR
jgi:beta-lactam-binding protein with PASTA domain